jgi:hypothetical protein
VKSWLALGPNAGYEGQHPELRGIACYSRVQLAVNGKDVTTFPLESNNVAMPSMDNSLRLELRVIGPV